MLQQSTCKHTLILVGADKGGVGKTMLTRALLDYLAGTTARVFDTEMEPGVLKRFCPTAQMVNLANSTDQARVIDGLGDARVTVVDIRAGLLSPTLHLFQRIGFKHGGDAHLVVMHVLGNSIASLGEIKNTAQLLSPGGDHVLVKNHLNDGKFFEWDDATQARYLGPVKPAALIEIGNLDAVSAERVDQASQTFARFADDAANSRVMRGLVRAWLGDIANEFVRIGLQNVVS